jgi:hypothetical protein
MISICRTFRVLLLLNTFFPWTECHIFLVFEDQSHQRQSCSSSLCCRMLCDPCSGLNLSPGNFIIQPDEDASKFDQYFDIGPLNDIRQRAVYCGLCRLVVESIGELDPGSSIKEKDIKCSFYWHSEGFIWGVEKPTVRRLRVSATPWLPSWPESNSITILSDDAPGGTQLFFGRKIRERQIDIKLIKKWLHKCQKWHGDECDTNLSTEWHSALPPILRVIDTWAMCIDEISYESKFLALSYVWGRSDVFKLTTENLAALQKPAALQRVWHDLPTTIRDAITLTSLLSIRYVWIDSICIVQDDDEDKMRLIPTMDLLYDNAFLTIVAASGNDANAGLPGVRKDSRGRQQVIEEVKTGLRLISPKHVTDSVDQSVWESRGWTYVTPNNQYSKD